ncbi:hypothetical protein QUB05_06710 [Microcoleus sp. F10-C6]
MNVIYELDKCEFIRYEADKLVRKQAFDRPIAKNSRLNYHNMLV